VERKTCGRSFSFSSYSSILRGPSSPPSSPPPSPPSS
jgi:hypothetical protein